MSKQPRLPKTRKTCIFCGSTNLSRTHIWPEWINQLFPGNHRQHEATMMSSPDLANAEVRVAVKLKQGKMTSQKPRLACISCNTGWMKRFEDAMAPILKPVIAGTGVAILNQRQARIFAGWVSLIFTLAEYTSGVGATLPEHERKYLKKYQAPSTNWSIYVAGLNAPSWVARHDHNGLHSRRLRTSLDIIRVRNSEIQGANAHISSMGIGRLFFHAYYTPINEHLRDFDVACKAAGLVRIWPPRRRLWPLPERKLHLPPDVVFDDERATEVSKAFYHRLMFRESLNESMKRDRPAN